MSDPLDELLRAEPYLDDKGFTQRVIASLPKRKAAAQGRRWVLLGSGLSAAAVFAVGPGHALTQLLASAHPSFGSLAAAAVALVVGAGTAVSVALREAQG
jgi:hypothetical protein